MTTLAWAKPVRDGHVEVELVAQPGAAVAGQPLELGVHFKMDEHWHVYWKNPGATGYPPKFTWHLPKGWTAGEVAWPVPQRLVIADLQQFVYEKEVLLTTKVTVPADYQGEPVKLSAEVDWLACSESCIPGKAKVELQLPEAAVPSALFDKAAAGLPQSTGNITLRSWRLGPKKAFLDTLAMRGIRPILPPATRPTLTRLRSGRPAKDWKFPSMRKTSACKACLVSKKAASARVC